MKPMEKLAPPDEVIEAVREMAQKKDEFVRGMRKTFDAVGDDLNRGLKKARYAADEAVGEARHGIRKHPIAAVGITAVGGIFLGLIAGYVIGRTRD